MKNFGYLLVGIIFLLIVSLATIVSTKYSDDEEVDLAVNNSPVKTYTITFPLSEIVKSHNNDAFAPDGPASQWQYYSEAAPQNMAITKISTVVENAPQDIIHHLTLVGMGAPSIICADTINKNYREYYTVSRTNIHEELVFPAPYALQIHEGESLSLEVMTHILDKPYGPGGDYEDAVVKIVMEYTDFASRPNPLAFIRLRLDDTPCAEPVKHQAYKVPANIGMNSRISATTSDSSSVYTFPADGVIVTRSANIWGTKGGKYVKSYINGELLDELQAVQGKNEWQWSIDSKNNPVVVKAGDEITMEAVYENNTDKDIVDASGMYGFYYAPDLD